MISFPRIVYNCNVIFQVNSLVISQIQMHEEKAQADLNVSATDT